MIRRLAGVAVVMLGVILGGWVAYNLFIHRLPETQGRSPIPAIAISAVFIYVGVKWIRGKVAS